MDEVVALVKSDLEVVKERKDAPSSWVAEGLRQGTRGVDLLLDRLPGVLALLRACERMPQRCDLVLEDRANTHHSADGTIELIWVLPKDAGR